MDHYPRKTNSALIQAAKWFTLSGGKRTFDGPIPNDTQGAEFQSSDDHCTMPNKKDK